MAGSEDTYQDLAYLIVVAGALVGAERLWSTKLEPWAAAHLHGLAAHQASVGPFTLSVIDLAALAVALTAALAVALSIRKRRAERAAGDGR